MVPTALREIAGDDEELLMQLLADLAQSLSKSIELLRNAESDDEVRQFAHRLKGGALGIGSERLAALAVSAERNPHLLRELMAEIDAVFAEEFGQLIDA
ncbi:hypothetical protein B5C34_11455 [Pacificimonas flava]|uniref:HPt domain-containing protein n=2 Tax=Pacificimonas TaxID=1960290 RepID=A0A219B6N3_9SPHN|nr:MULTISPECIES: Hpt domain-containing protein [Pacificimonas]MBZ6378716.1 Hpt domain-containing protein [Pacificimonas aurantium]OWV34015.1 hypothetical protein B5C34_11455 [Pacificimonas flava]